MIVYLTRHGQPQPAAEEDHDPQYPPGDPPLSELGRRQARRLGQRLAGTGFRGVIYASPYRRTAETADIIAAVLGLHFYPEPAIRELTGPGIFRFHGLDLGQLRALCPRLAPEASLDHPWWTRQPEPVDEAGQRPLVQVRVGAFLQPRLDPASPDILAVGHGASVGAAVKYLFDRRAGGEFARPGSTWNCSLTAFRVDREGLFPVFHGDVSHLPPGEVTANSRYVADSAAG